MIKNFIFQVNIQIFGIFQMGIERQIKDVDDKGMKGNFCSLLFIKKLCTSAAIKIQCHYT